MQSTGQAANTRIPRGFFARRVRGLTLTAALGCVFAALACHTGRLSEPGAHPGAHPGAPARSAAVTHVSFDLTVDWERQRLAGSATLWLRALRPESREVHLAAQGLTVREVLDGEGRALAWHAGAGTLAVQLAAPLPWPAPEGVDEPIRIVYAAGAGPALTFGGATRAATFRPEVQARPGAPGAWAPLPRWAGERATADARVRVGHGMLAVAAGEWVGVEEHGGGERTAIWRLAAPVPLAALGFAAARFEVARADTVWPVVTYSAQGGAAGDAGAHTKAPMLLGALAARLGPGLPLGAHGQVVLQRWAPQRAAPGFATGAWFEERPTDAPSALAAVAEGVARRWFGVTLAPLDAQGAALVDALARFAASTALVDIGAEPRAGVGARGADAAVLQLRSALGDEGLWRTLRALCAEAAARPRAAWLTADTLRSAALAETGHDVGALLRRFRP